MMKRKVSLYINSLTKYNKSKIIWKKPSNLLVSKKDRDSNEKHEIDLNKKYGFWIEHGKYFLFRKTASMNGQFHHTTTFFISRIPYKLVSTPSKNELGVEELVEMRQEDLISLQKFKQKSESLGKFYLESWWQELTKLKCYLYEKYWNSHRIEATGMEQKGILCFLEMVYFTMVVLCQWMIMALFV